MAALILTQICIALLGLILLIRISGRRLSTYRPLLVLFFVVFFADNILIALANRFSNLQLIPNHVWEGFLVCGWSGKLYSILFAIVLFYLCRKVLTNEDAGLILRQNPGSFLHAGAVMFALSVWAWWVGIHSPKGEPDLQTLLYLAIMPGLNEEVVYRGILLGSLDKIMPARRIFLAAPIGWGVITTSLMFGLLHGLWLDSNLSFHVEVAALRNAVISGFIFAWLRVRTGSLVLPIVAHGLEDLLFFLPRMM